MRLTIDLRLDLDTAAWRQATDPDADPDAPGHGRDARTELRAHVWGLLADDPVLAQAGAAHDDRPAGTDVARVPHHPQTALRPAHHLTDHPDTRKPPPPPDPEVQQRGRAERSQQHGNKQSTW